VFQLYQFIHSEREANIVASIDIGKKYLSDSEVTKGRNVAIGVARNEVTRHFPSGRLRLEPIHVDKERLESR